MSIEIQYKKTPIIRQRVSNESSEGYEALARAGIEMAMALVG
jgi:hypothetical protein